MAAFIFYSAYAAHLTASADITWAPVHIVLYTLLIAVNVARVYVSYAVVVTSRP